MAGYISDDLISEICADTDIIDYVSQYVPLKRSGSDFSGLCPFHHEKTPSFHVSRDKQLFHCFGCGASGNLIQFVMRMENLDFTEAVRSLADRAGIVIPDESGSTAQEHSKKQKILEMNKLAARFFHNCLKDKQTGAPGRRYLIKRRISWKTVVTYGLGFAPAEKTALTDYMKERGYTEGQMLEAGLSIERDKKVIDKFRNRVIFPIINVRGEVIGFGGRIMDDANDVNGFKIPKYLNSAETPAFDKGRNLYSLNIAKNARSGNLILCEGYMDVISTYQAGITNVIATLGTAITPNQAKLMLRYAHEILICYDSDEAGTKAAVKAIDVIAEAGGKSRVIRLKDAKDPDEYINKNGVEGFKDEIKKASPSTEFKISLVKSKYDTSTTDGKVRFLDDVIDVFASIRDPVEIDAYAKKVSDETGIDKQAILSKLREKNVREENYRRRAPQRIERRHSAVVKTEDGTVKRIPSQTIEAEKRLLNLMASEKKYYSAAKSLIAPEDFSTPVHKRLASLIGECYNNGKIPDQSLILNEFSSSDDEMNEASAVFYNMEVYKGGTAVIYDLIYTIKYSKIQTLIKGETDAEKLKELFRMQNELKERRKTWEVRAT